MSPLGALLFAGGLGVAVANGANDNGKPVATLIGSGILSMRRGLGLAFWTTLAGALMAAWWSRALLRAFSGQGLVAQGVASQPIFLPAVGLGALVTVALATRMRLPVSTTHALVGGLVGAGLVLGHGFIAWRVLLLNLAGPILLSPVVALALAYGVSLLVRGRASAVMQQGCVCAAPHLVPSAPGTAALSGPTLLAGSLPECQGDNGFVILPPVGKVLRGLHVLSAGAVSFSRGLNDTPKIAALLVPLGFLAGSSPVVTIALAMGVGGWFLARGVARTMSQDIVELDQREPEALGANLTTAFLVLLASRWGLPVSTTHVATGAMAGTGLSHGEFRISTLRNILLAWVATLPLAGAVAALLVLALKVIS